MAEESKKNKKGLIIGICCGVVVVATIVVALVLVLNKKTINDDYFTSDGTKYVLTLEQNEVALEDEEYAPIKTHMVYYYSGDEVTGMTIYYEYLDEAAAKTAFEYISKEEREGVKETKLNGKYIEITSSEDQYSDMTSDEVKQNIEFMELLKSMNYDTGDGYDYESYDYEEDEDETFDFEEEDEE